VLAQRDGAAKRRLSAREAPRKTAEEDLLVEDLVDLTAEVLDVHHVVRKQQRVHDLVVGLRKDLIQTAPELLLGLLRLIGADAANHRIHGVVRAAGIERDPAHAAVEHPLRERARGTGMTAEVLRLIQVRAVGPVLRIMAVIAGVDEQDVAALDAQTGVVLPALDMLGSVQVVVAEAEPFELDYRGGNVQEIHWEVDDEL